MSEQGEPVADPTLEAERLLTLASKWATAAPPTQGDPVKVLLVGLLTSEIATLAKGVLSLADALAECDRQVRGKEKVVEAAGAVAPYLTVEDAPGVYGCVTCTYEERAYKPGVHEPECEAVALRSALDQEKKRGTTA